MSDKEARMMLAAVHIKNLIAKFTDMNNAEYKIAAVPEVGLFWMSLDGRKFFSRTVSLGEADSYGEFKICDVSHYSVWPQAQQKYTVWQAKEYEEVPRGRVVFKVKPGKFIIYMPKELNRHESMILQKLRIPSSLAEFDYSDIHYQLNPSQKA